MAARMRAYDWATSCLGTPDQWPQSLKTVVSMMLTSRYAMWMGWGEDLIFLHNDAYAPTLGVKEGTALGKPAAQVWAEIWADIGPRVDSVLKQGVATYDEHLLLFLERSGFAEETYHTFSYSPLTDDTGVIAGMLCVVTEDTVRVIGERRLALLRDLAAAIGVSPLEIDRLDALDVLRAQRDLPFVHIYLFDGETETSARLAFSTGGEPIAAPYISWPLRAIIEGSPSVLIDSLETRFSGPVPSGPWDRPPSQAVAVPIPRSGHAMPAGVMVFGVNPYHEVDGDYLAFVDLLVGQIATSLANARAMDEARRRAEALAALDRAKTAFFSNVSHEFRTPLTLLLGPLEELLHGTPLDDGARGRVDMAHRNALRLLTLVNTLLDFSRMEAGRANAQFQPTDLAAFTHDLASNFRSACEKAGLSLRIDCAPLPGPVHVDRGMWERIVLNLLSNAFKFTFEGGIHVSLSAHDGVIDFSVTDTGTGIPDAELPRLFERFHRVDGARGRSHEGSGIGLATVHELVKLHGGAIEVSSREGEGTCFRIMIPSGTSHLPQAQVRETADEALPGALTGIYADEALRWVDPGDDEDAETVPASPGTQNEDRSLILLADDNADMRRYVARLLSPAHQLIVAADGQEALDAARTARPDLILTDIMMPRMDGYELLRRIREDADLRDTPVVLLSARAGEEAGVEGLQAGADDYLVKPFSAREVIARVNSLLKLSRLRRRHAETLRELNAGLRERAEEATADRDRIWRNTSDLMLVLDEQRDILSVNPAWETALGWREHELIGRPAQDFIHPEDREMTAEQARRQRVEQETHRFENRYRHRDGGFRWIAWDAVSEGGKVHAIGRDVTAEKEAAQALRQAEEQLRQAQKMEAVGKLTGGVAHDFNNLLQVIAGNLQLLSKDVVGNERAERRLRNALGGVFRGSKLASQLLAFGRRQPLDPRVVNLGRFVRSLDDLLRRAIGEEIELETVIGGGLWNTFVDPAQVENALLNLAINARDAMGGRGRLTIEAGNAYLDDAYAARHSDIPPGQYVMLAVTDTGSGIPPEILDQVFEPFFTTKPEGQGTGLGLSMVYGFVKQSGGHAKIYSEVGQGTTVRIYLPRSTQQEDMPAPVDTGPVRGGSETVLVVEDDEGVRNTVVEILSDLGYRILTARDAQSALAIVESGVPIDLLFTDVVMPGPLRSPELARKAKERLPELIVLFTSGYTENAIVHGGQLDTGTNLLSKPYTRETLARKLRQVLAGRDAAAD
ncbi:ATP-binding protein [Iodidimonas sp. SYSU 1G8]|uniref:ATP-binding protein n=1 Tax=Iodidimonas sp. SYSU 1G8 TaxID=3133967 RepID=UPI0031FE7B1E